jgi:hypothetical protein
MDDADRCAVPVAVMTFALRSAPLGSVAEPYPDSEPVILLDHDTDWGREFRARLLSGGFDVWLGPNGVGLDCNPVLVMQAASYGLGHMRNKVRRAQAVFPEAPLMLVTAAAGCMASWPADTAESGGLCAALRAARVGFIHDAAAKGNAR